MCATTVHAIRDTELACLPAGLLNTVKLKHPQVVSRLIQVLGERILGNYTRMASPISSISTASLAGEREESGLWGAGESGRLVHQLYQVPILLYQVPILLWVCYIHIPLGSLVSSDTKKHMVSNLSTVAVVPITSDVCLSYFTEELCAAINSIGVY